MVLSSRDIEIIHIFNRVMSTPDPAPTAGESSSPPQPPPVSQLGPTSDSVPDGGDVTTTQQAPESSDATSPTDPVTLLLQAIVTPQTDTVPEVEVPEIPPIVYHCMACCAAVTIVADPRETITPPTESPDDPEKPPALQLPCPFAHIYCVPCLELCISTRLEDGRKGRKVFPMSCPDCPSAYGWWFMDIGVAEKVLSVVLLDEWKEQEFLESIPKMYCPNSRCSELVQLPDADCTSTEADCPSCQTTICVPCRSASHFPLTCARWQKSPESLNPEEIHLRKLAKRHHWRRCTQCRMIVERTEGCSHMTCRCGREFCHQCGADWLNGCTDVSRCGWKNDASLYVPSRFTTLVRHTATLTRRSLSDFGSFTRSKLGRTASSGDTKAPPSPTVVTPSNNEIRPGLSRRSTILSWMKS